MKKIMFNDKYGLTQAVLNGRKTQTRRIITPQPTYKDNCGICWKGYAYGLSLSWDKLEGCYRNFISGTEYDKSCKRYRKGEVIAVAQSYNDCGYKCFHYRDTDEFMYIIKDNKEISICPAGVRNKMFVAPSLMPHQIHITNVRVERLQDISDEDCLKEGITDMGAGGSLRYSFTENVKQTTGDPIAFSNNFAAAKEAFAHLINKVSKKGTWESNPYVFVYDFELVK